MSRSKYLSLSAYHSYRRVAFTQPEIYPRFVNLTDDFEFLSRSCKDRVDYLGVTLTPMALS